MKNPIDADRIKLFPKDQQREYRRQCHEFDGGCNDAELVAEMRRSGDLKSVAIPAIPSVRASRESVPAAGFVSINGRMYHKSKVVLDVMNLRYAPLENMEYGPWLHLGNCKCPPGALRCQELVTLKRKAYIHGRNCDCWQCRKKAYA